MEGANLELFNSMYNEDGSFIPFTKRDGNIRGDIADHRNTFMEAEREYYQYLLSKDSNCLYVFDLLENGDSEKIFQRALKLQEQLESGNIETEYDKQLMECMTPVERELYHLHLLEIVETEMCLLFSAVSDKVKIHEEKEYSIDDCSNGNQKSRRSK